VDLFQEVEFEPTLKVVTDAIRMARGNPYDLVIGFGGGSALDAAKVIACLAKNEGNPEDYIGTNKIPNGDCRLFWCPRRRAQAPR